MLLGVNVKPASMTEATMLKMDSSDIPFLLTGSRYFGWERPDSDWDFFAESSVKASTTLKLFGFEESAEEGYQDGLTRQVFAGNSIHVQLVTSTIEKDQLNRFFLRNKFLLATRSYSPRWETIWTPKSKEEQKAAWHTAVAMLFDPIGLK